eukprot:5353840-Pleurochrysis_carterae.AAC.1
MGVIAGMRLDVELGKHPLERMVLLEHAKNALAVEVGVACEVRERGKDVDDVGVAVDDHAGDVQFHCVDELF